MLFHVRYRDQEYHVRVEYRKNSYFVKFGDEPEFEADVFFYGSDCNLLDPFEVFTANLIVHRDLYTVWKAQGISEFLVESEHRRMMRLMRGKKSIDDENKIVAKMPGRISKVFVKDGDLVEVNQSLLVMEAMKMENEIRSLVSGRVVRVGIVEGQAVESGAFLVEIEPL